MNDEKEIIDDSYIEQLIDAAYIGGNGRFMEVSDTGKNFARLEGGTYSYRSPKTFGVVKQFEGVELRRLKKIFMGLISRYNYFKIKEYQYSYRGGEWHRTYDLGK
ncbi:hypothetical protein [Leeuwenhoekiella sp. LLG6367-2.1]|uniref:hypothetical protein n=1 Tax=Leeuwenhoekiella sp. LLG6367-2.1 TaxID=3160833 RepID=UPI00386EE948